MNKFLSLGVASSIVISIVALVLSISNEQTKIGHVDIKKVFDSFDMKKELEANLDANLLTKRKVLDSLSFQLQLLNQQYNAKAPSETELNNYQKLQQQFLYEKQQFEDFNEQTIANSNKQIIDQMTQYIKDFATKEGYTYILGMNEDGNVLYGMESLDITDQAIKYINNSYQGKND